MDIVVRTLVVFIFLWLAIRVSGRREVAQLSAFDMILLDDALGHQVASSDQQDHVGVRQLEAALMDIVVRTLVVFIFLWLAIRVSGRREVAQLSAFDMILLVTAGDLVAQGVVQEDYSLTAALVAVSTMTLAGLALAWLAFRFPRTRPVISGVPRVVVRDGEPVLDVLDAERLTIADVQEACREQGIRRLRDVELCVLETDGGFSFFTRGEQDEGAPEHGVAR